MKRSNDESPASNELIDISQVSELNEVSISSDGITVGGALSLSKVIAVLDEYISKSKGK